jgi:multidrug efflux pump subunit AcrA (membrane-fusion protein)
MFIMTLIALVAASFQQSEPAVSEAAISIHTVQRGNMRLRLILQGAITSVQPATATVSGPLAVVDHLKTGQAVEFEFQGRRVGGSLPMLAGTVTRLQGGNGSDLIRAEIGFSDSVPEGTTIGTRIGALVDTGEELKDIVFFGRPADSKPNTESTIFLIEPGGEYAKRVPVRYGRQSGAQMEIISGLVPGDKVIVTDMSAWSGYPRVRLK